MSPGRDFVAELLGISLREGDGSALGWLGDEFIAWYLGRDTGRGPGPRLWVASFTGTGDLRWFSLDGLYAGARPGVDAWEVVVVLVARHRPDDEELAALASTILLAGLVVEQGGEG